MGTSLPFGHGFEIYLMPLSSFEIPEGGKMANIRAGIKA